VFRDREARRFAYEAMGPWLAALAAGALLLSVASRRLALPDALRKARRKPAVGAGAEAVAAAYDEPETRRTAPQTLAALRAKRGRRLDAGAEPDDVAAPAPPLVIRSPAPDTSPEAASPRAPDTDERKKSAAEILLERRKSRTRR
jgi:hypothetical protein